MNLVLISEKKIEMLETLGTQISNSDGKYNAECYSAYLTAFEKIKSDINSAVTATELSIIDVDARRAEAESLLELAEDEIVAKKAELLTILGEKKYNDDGRYTLDSYEAYSDAYKAIKDIIDKASDLSVLNVLDVAVLRDAAESKLVLDKAESSDAPQIEDVKTETNTETEIETEIITTVVKKCGASVAFSAVALVTALGTALLIKRKD